ncbi:MAG: hypothetical protein LBN24_12780 [Mediterranea sp.]|jgi:outer membrane lipoprotein-sorting protein|nr:hypothetical protein [Mediterranea sp.]
MRKYIFSAFIALASCLPALAQTGSVQAKQILDHTAEAFRKAGGVTADFRVEVLTNGTTEGEDTGTIQLRGEKFQLTTSSTITWFDGRTQWSYVTQNDEVNISTPTPGELQQLNPYAFLYMYREGFSYRLGADKNIHGKAATEVILTATNPKQEWERITLCVDRQTYQPLLITLRQRGQATESRITITGYQTRQRFGDKLFTFDRKEYPQAEIIDLR